MTTKFSFRPNPAIVHEIQHEPGMVKHFGDVAQDAANMARSIAPVDTGDYMRSIKPHVEFQADGDLLARVDAWDYKAWWIEIGTHETANHGGTPAFATLRLGCDMAGLHVVA